MRRPSRRISRLLGFTVVPVSLVATGLFVTASSYSVFNATTSNSSNSWTTGSVNLTDDDAAGAMFTVTNLKPGQAGSRCIVVSTAANNLPAKVALYSDTANYNNIANSSAALAGAINLTIDMGASASTFTNSSSSTATPACTLTTASSVYSGTIAGFNTARTNYTTGSSVPAAVWQTVGGASAESKVYRFQWNLPDGGQPSSSTTGDNQYQSKATRIDFIWESQSF